MAIRTLFSRRRSDAATELRPLQPRTNLPPSVAPSSTRPSFVNNAAQLPTFQKPLPQLLAEEPLSMSPVSSMSAPDPPYPIPPPPVQPPPGTPFTLPPPMTLPPLVTDPVTPPPTSPVSPTTPTNVAHTPMYAEVTPNTPLRSHPTYTMQPCVIVGMAGRGDRPAHTESLPAGWTKSHDHIICIYESRGHSSEEIIKRLRNLDPNLKGIISPAQIDKRLRQLDQIPEVDYWRRPYTSGAASTAPTTFPATSTKAAAAATKATANDEVDDGPSRYVRRWSRSNRPDLNAPPPPPSRSLAQIVEAHQAEEKERTRRGLGRFGARPHAITTNERVRNY